MADIRKKPQMQNIKKLNKTDIKPKTLQEIYKIKTAKKTAENIKTRKELINKAHIKIGEGDKNSFRLSQFKVTQAQTQAKQKSDNQKQSSSKQGEDFSSAQSQSGLKKKFQTARLKAKKAGKLAIKTAAVANNAMAETANSKQVQENQSMQETALQTQNTITEKIKDMAKHKAMKRAQKLAQDGVKQTAVATVKATYRTAKFVAKKVAEAMVKLARIAYASFGGGIFFVCFIAMFAILAIIIASPFGIFYSGEDTNNPNVVPVSAVVGQLNADFGLQMEAIQDSVPHDSVTIDGNEADMCEVLAVFAVKYSSENDVVTIDAARVEQIKAVFWDMNSLTYDTEVVTNTNDDGSSSSETVLHIHINHKTADDMRIEYGFNIQENEALDGMLQYRSVLLSLMGSLNEVQGDAQHWLDNLDPATPEDQRRIVEAACSLVGKVNYFWGGKYPQIGWNSEWGTIKQVTSAGSPTTGTMRVYGLDCSGFVTWVFINASGNLGAYSIIGDGTKSQWANATEISWSDAQIGDLVFYPDLSHVGVVIGVDSDGDVAIANCASGANNVVITGKSGFTLIARPSFSMFQQ